LTAARRALVARRVRLAEAALEAVVDAAVAALAPDAGPVELSVPRFAGLPAEIALRLLGRAIARVGNEGPVELGKLEALYAGLAASPDVRFRRTLAGAVITRSGDRLTVERA